jgi:DNA repair photolyase
LILRHVEVLAELDRRHAVTVRMMVPTVDPELAERLEPGEPDPRARLRAVRQLAEEGIETRVLCSPWLPGLHDRESVLSPLFAAAREAGAYDVQLPRDLRGTERKLSRTRRDRRLALFQRLRLEHGFPQTIPGRG